MKNKIFEKKQDEGLAIVKLHDKLNELNINHEFIDRKKEEENLYEEQIKRIIVNHIYPFDLQILIMENGNKISLVQSPFSYGITENLIEVYNFQHEPVILDDEMAAELISKKKLNSYIIAVNDKTDEDMEDANK